MMKRVPDEKWERFFWLCDWDCDSGMVGIEFSLDPRDNYFGLIKMVKKKRNN